MSDKMTMFERRLEELFFISNRQETSVPELASCFSVSRNTAYRDVEFLSRYAPIYTKNGMYGGVFIVEGYKNSITPFLTYDERLLLEKIAKSLTGNDAKRLNNIINKYSMPKLPSGT